MVTYESVLDALGDPTRRQIVEVLRAGPAAVGQLAERLPVSRPAISQHLRVLLLTGLVGYESVGTRNVYHLHPDGLRELHAWVSGFWDDVLSGFSNRVREDGVSTPPSIRARRRRPDA